MSPAAYEKFVEALRPKLVGNDQVPDSFTGQITEHMNEGGITHVWANGPLKGSTEQKQKK